MRRAAGCIAAVSAVGAGVGATLGFEEIGRQAYLGLGLWHTSLWITSRDSWLGWAIGAVCALAAILLLTAWSRLSARPAGQGERFHPRESQPWGTRLILMLALFTAATVLLVPRRSSSGLALPYADLTLSMLVLLWAGLLAIGAGVATRASEAERAELRFRLRWLAVTSFAWLIVFLNLYARLRTWPLLLGASALVTVAFAGAYYAAIGFARGVHAWTARSVGSAPVGALARVVVVGVLALAPAVWLSSHAVARRARGAASLTGRNVILIVVDTVRADCTSLLSSEDGPLDLTPNLRTMVASRGTVFTRAISQAPWTMPAVSSILTGLYPKEHGAEQRWAMLSPRILTLAEILREKGYRTMGASAALYVTEASGLRQGFEFFDESQARGQETVSSPYLTDKAIEYLDTRGGEPFFLLVHYFDPHWAYREHQEYDFAAGYDGWLKQASQTLRQDDFTQYVYSVRPRPLRQLLDPDEMAYLRDLYHGEIAYTDAYIGRLLDRLQQAGLDENTLIVVVADHGEEFLERGNLGHGATVNQELVHVPLAIAGSSESRPHVVSRPVETRSIFTTVLDFLRIDKPGNRTLPPSLLEIDDDPPTYTRSETYPNRTPGSGEGLWLTCIQDDRWKLMKEHLRGRSLLFDLAEDPGETRDCRQQHPDRFREMEKELDRQDAAVRGQEGPSTGEASEEQKRKLKSLGYL